MSVPEEDSSLSSLLTSQSRLLENCVQLLRFPRINAAAGHEESVHESAHCLMWRLTQQKNNVTQRWTLWIHAQSRLRKTLCFDTLKHISFRRCLREKVGPDINIWGQTHPHVRPSMKKTGSSDAGRQRRKEGGIPNPLSAALNQVCEEGGRGTEKERCD